MRSAMSEPRSTGPDAARLLFGAREGVGIAFTALRTNPFRSALTVLGVGVGVCVVVLMAALISGVRGSIQEGIEAAGPHNFSLLRVSPDEVQLVNAAGTRQAWEDRPLFTLEEVDRVSRVEGVGQVLPQYVLADPGGGGGTRLRAGTVEVTGIFTTGEGPGWQAANHATFIEGRDFVSVEFDEARHVVVLSERVARSLDPDASLVGRRVLLHAQGRALPLTVVGVFQPVEIPFEEATGYRAVVPHTTAIRRYRTGSELEGFTVVPAPGYAPDAVEDAVIAALRTLRGLPPGTENDFSVLRATQILELFDRFTAVFFVVMLALSSVGLVVGGVGVVGMMLISVTERTREIGIRKAVGATRGEILWQFLVEAGVLTLLGGALGLLIGGGGAWLLRSFTPVPATVPLWSVAVALAASLVTGMVFGLVPAMRAARMTPVDALGHE